MNKSRTYAQKKIVICWSDVLPMKMRNYSFFLSSQQQYERMPVAMRFNDLAPQIGSFAVWIAFEYLGLYSMTWIVERRRNTRRQKPTGDRRSRKLYRRASTSADRALRRRSTLLPLALFVSASPSPAIRTEPRRGRITKDGIGTLLET